MRARWLALLVLVLVLAAACSSRDSAKVEPAKGSAAPRDAASADAGPKEAERTDAEARAILVRWKDAQNAGAFRDYEALYATKFEGVRRSGRRVARMERARWMRERARMFRAKMQVDVTAVDVRATRDTAVVRFTQTWESGRYKDVGPKVLLLAREGGVLRIAREEMLASTIERGPPVDDDQFAFVEAVGGRFIALLDPVAAPWASSPPRLTASESTYRVVERDVDTAQLPPPMARWQGASLVVHAVDGSTCAARVTGLTLVARYLPYQEEIVEWRELSDSEIAEVVWQEGEPRLGAVLEPEGACGAPAFARVARLSAPTVWTATPADAPLHERALDGFRALPAFADIQRGYASHLASADRWDEDASARLAIGVWRSAASADVFVTVSAAVAAGEGCDLFEADLTAMWRLDGGELRFVGSVPRPTLLLDLDGDGQIEVFHEERAYGLTRVLVSGPTLEMERARDSVTNMDCRC